MEESLKKLREFETKFKDLVYELLYGEVSEEEIKEYFGSSSAIADAVIEMYEEIREDEDVLKKLCERLR